jgi:hypothetical protein
MDEIINRVSQSTLLTLDLEEYYPKGDRVLYDLKDNLYEGIILKEKDFRSFLKNNDWSNYKNKFVAITCTADAIIPTWAYMLLSTYLAPYAQMVVFGDLSDLESAIFQKALTSIQVADYQDKKVVIKGCSKYPVPISAYVAITQLLQPYVSSLMFGEPCSTVPLYKKKTP